jgi:hypothetical protein
MRNVLSASPFVLNSIHTGYRERERERETTSTANNDKQYRIASDEHANAPVECISVDDIYIHALSKKNR